MAHPQETHGEKPVPSQRVEVPWPEAGAALHLRVAVGACRVRLSPGGGASWAEGTYADPAGALPLDVRHEDGTVRITQARRFAEVLGLIHGVPTLDLALGKARPFSLTVESGASEVALELGGVPLERLALRMGAGKATCRFGAPNPSAMERVDVTASGAAIVLAGLGHAGFAEMAVSTGAASCDLDLSGPLRRDGRVRISAGVATVRISVPADTAARIVAETVLGGLDLGDGFTKRQGAFWTEGAVAGRTPALDVDASVSVGSLELRAR